MNSGVTIIKTEFNRYTRYRKKLYESVNTRVTYPTQGLFFFTFFNSLCIYDMIEYSSVVFMFKVYNNQFPRHLLCFFDRVYHSHNYNTRKNVNNFKMKYCRTSQKASCISVIGPKLWNNLHSDLQCSKSISRFKTHYKRMLLQRYEHLVYLSLNLSFIVYSVSYMYV